MTPNLSPLWSRLAIACVAMACLSVASFPAFADEEGEAKIDYKKLKSPVAYTEKSIARGRSLYMRRCTECHGVDGKGQMDVIADASDLTMPKLYYSGSTEGEIFRSIKLGAGVSMPPFKDQIRKEEDMWHLVNYIRSLWPADLQPELQEEPEGGQDEAEDPSEEGEGADE